MYVEPLGKCVIKVTVVATTMAWNSFTIWSSFLFWDFLLNPFMHNLPNISYSPNAIRHVIESGMILIWIRLILDMHNTAWKEVYTKFQTDSFWKIVLIVYTIIQFTLCAMSNLVNAKILATKNTLVWRSVVSLTLALPALPYTRSDWLVKSGHKQTERK